MHSNNTTDIKIKLLDSLKVIKIYEWLLDAYTLDFYVDKQWEKLPKSWIETLAPIPPEYLADLLICPKQKTERIAWPLALLALRKLLQRLNISRNPAAQVFKSKDESIEKNSIISNQSDSNNNPRQEFTYLIHPKISTILTKKNIKEKKRHEIERMSRFTADVAKELDLKYIVDFGSGVGHIARLLSYGYGLNVCCLEKEISLIEKANELDNQIADLTARIGNGITFRRPVHLNMCLSKDCDFTELVKNIKKCFNVDLNDNTFKFGIIGLHPCGDLASILMNFFLVTNEAKFINLVGCCYFKITTSNNLTDNIQNNGYPLSDYLRNIIEPKWHRLSFEAREIACHAIEVYANHLSNKNYDYLRVHSFRATIEKIICKNYPEHKHSGLRNIKHLTTFRDYCHQAVSHLEGVSIPESDINSPDTLENLEQWKLLVIFYTLRLMIAPLVESVIIYDRQLYLLEHGCSTKIDVLFDPKISARNQIITSIKSL